MEPTTEVVNLAPLIQPTVEWIAVLGAAAGAWAIKWIMHYVREYKVEQRSFGLLKERQVQAWLNEGLSDAIEYGRELVRNHGLDVAEVKVRNVLLRSAANYMLQHFPRTVADLGLDRERLIQMLMAKLPTPDQAAPDPLPLPSAIPVMHDIDLSPAATEGG